MMLSRTRQEDAMLRCALTVLAALVLVCAALVPARWLAVAVAAVAFVVDAEDGVRRL
jgi:hypothetical protein